MEKNQVTTIMSQIGDPIKAAMTLGDMFKESELFGIKTRAQGHVLALACITEGMSPFQLMRRFHLVEGRLTQRADAMLAEFKAHGGKCKWLQWDEEAAKASFEYQGETLENSFTWEMAQKARYPFKADGGIKANWAANRPDMLRARLITKTLRMIAPDLVSGIYTPEEFDDDRAPIVATITTENAAPLLNPSKEVIPPAVVIEPEPKKESAPTAEVKPEPKAETKAEPKTEAVTPPKAESAPTAGAAEFLGDNGEVFKTQVEADLSFFEPAANMYLSKFLKWIKPGTTFRDLSELHINRIKPGNNTFRDKCETYYNEQMQGVV